MGNTFSSTHMFVSQSSQITNDIYIKEESTCDSSCKLTFNNNSVIISGSSGNITIANVCHAKAGCIISQHIKTKLINDIVQESNQVEDHTPNSLFEAALGSSLNDVLETTVPGINIHEKDLTSIQSTVVANDITQKISSSCTGHTSVSNDDNLYVIKDFTGNVDITNEGTAAANCNMTNVASLSVQNDISQSVKQTVNKVGLFAVIIIAVCVIGGVIAAISLGGKSKDNRAKAKQKDSVSELQDDQDAKRKGTKKSSKSIFSNSSTSTLLDDNSSTSLL